MPITRRGLLAGAPLLLSKAEAEVTPAIVRFGPEMDPLVKRLEDCDREQFAAVAADMLRSGVTYRQLLSAVFLAGIRNVNPRPPGFALHCVFLAHAANTLAMEAPADSRWMPLFYTIDDFKSSQQRDLRSKAGDYAMQAIDDGKLPSPDRAAAELIAAMEAWDADRSERAIAALVRHRSPNDVFEILWRWAVRDYRNIGHKAIFAANACRTLQTIGWRHAEPVLRSLVLGLCDFGPTLEMNGFAYENQSWHANVAHMRSSFGRLGNGWLSAPASSDQTRAVLEALRSAAPAKVGASIGAGKLNAASFWDAIHLFAAELRMRSTGPNVIGGIHAVSTANAMHYAFQAANEPALRYLVLLQAAGWMAQFRQWMESRTDAIRKFSITDDLAGAGEPMDVQAILTAIPGNLDAAAQGVFALANKGAAARQAYQAASLRTTITKADEVHYMKYAASLLEDVPQVSPQWQPHLLAASVFYAKGSADKDPVWAARAREALRSV